MVSFRTYPTHRDLKKIILQVCNTTLYDILIELDTYLIFFDIYQILKKKKSTNMPLNKIMHKLNDSLNL